jgi:hypothetical protein
MQVVSSRGTHASIVVERNLDTEIVTMVSTEVSDMRVYTEKATLVDIDDEETHAHPWVSDFNSAGVPSNV